MGESWQKKRILRPLRAAHRLGGGRMSRKGALLRSMYIRINKKWVYIGVINRKGKVTLENNVDTILEEAFE